MLARPYRIAGGLAALMLVLACVASVASVARASSGQESIFQDDDHLLYGSTPTVEHTLGVLHSLGVDRVRLIIKWSAIAPDLCSATRPAHFQATDPAAYPSVNWARYDRIVQLAPSFGISVDFNVTAPGPLWAMKGGAGGSSGASCGPSVAREADHYAPSVNEWAQFVYALGVRYSGSYVPPAVAPAPAPSSGATGLTLPVAVPGLSADSPAGALPRVNFWTVWNEPNVDGWLAPQWRVMSGRTVPNSPRLYREYANAGLLALYDTGHTPASDTLLIGETAPEGHTHPTSYPEMEPMPFLRGLYCLDAHYHRLRGTAATDLGCPTSGSAASFIRANAGLFVASGWAHHPYLFLQPPSFLSNNVGWVPLANLSRLEGGLDRALRTYGVHRQLPIWLTEFGYETNPPNPYLGVAPSTQAAWINQADYMAWRDPRVRSVAQFLLVDSARTLDSTFQTGLQYVDGTAKPALAAYRLPIYAPVTQIARGAALTLWGQLRPAPAASRQSATVLWSSGHGAARALRSVNVPSSSVETYFTTSVRPPGSGQLLIRWRSPTGATFTSRALAVSVR